MWPQVALRVPLTSHASSRYNQGQVLIKFESSIGDTGDSHGGEPAEPIRGIWDRSARLVMAWVGADLDPHGQVAAMRTYSFHDALARHPEVTGRPVRVSALRDHFTPRRRNSCESLLIKMGPFVRGTDAFQFPNDYPLSTLAAAHILSFFESEFESAVEIATGNYSAVLNSLSIPDPIPFAPDISLPQEVIDIVINAVADPINAELGELISAVYTGRSARCGGMAFAAYDYYQVGLQAADFGKTIPPEGSVLDQYILDRLNDSLELNAGKFLEWLMILYVLPNIDNLAMAALGAAVGEAGGGPIGAVIGAWLGSQVNIFDLGGAGKLKDMTVTDLNILKARLDEEAAWPIGLIFGDKKSPLDQHQLLAIGYETRSDNRLAIAVWDNRDITVKEMILDLSGDELVETGVENVVKGVFVEEYAPKQPP
jgi:hypothetical protein